MYREDFLNLTPHEIVLGGYSIPPSGLVARVSALEKHVDDLDVGHGSIPVVTVRFGGIVGIPEDIDFRKMIIVSSLVASAIEAGDDCPLHTVYTPHDLVRDKQGRIIGASALRRIDNPEVWRHG